MQNSFLKSLGAERITKIIGEAFAEAAAENAALGLAEPVLIEGVVYCQYPDGHMERYEKQDTKKINL